MTLVIRSLMKGHSPVFRKKLTAPLVQYDTYCAIQDGLVRTRSSTVPWPPAYYVLKKGGELHSEFANNFSAFLERTFFYL